MIKITNGKFTLTVTKGSFKTIYESQGYKVVESAPTESSEEVGTILPEMENELLADSTQQGIGESDEEQPPTPGEDRELEEIPLSEMDYYQLTAYADKLGVDRTGLRSTKDLRRVIRAALKGA